MTDRTHPDSGFPIAYSHYANYAEYVEALHARIAELEAQLPNGGGALPEGITRDDTVHGETYFTAADMATASAQGFRDGVASLAASAWSGPLMGQPQEMPDLTKLTERGAKAWAGVDAQGLRDGVASAGGEPVAWVDKRALAWLANSRSLSATITTKLEKGKSFERPMPLYLHPSPPEGMVGEWIALPGTLPEPGTPVLLDIGKKYPIRAMWAAKHTVPAAGDDTDWGEYDEATDQYWCPEGWYEWNEHEDTNWAVSATPRAWAPLPPTSSADSRKGE